MKSNTLYDRDVNAANIILRYEQLTTLFFLSSSLKLNSFVLVVFLYTEKVGTNVITIKQ